MKCFIYYFFENLNLFQHETARRILDKMVQKSDDTDDSIPLAKASLLMREKKLAEANQLLQVSEKNIKTIVYTPKFSFRNLLKIINQNVSLFIVV